MKIVIDGDVLEKFFSELEKLDDSLCAGISCVINLVFAALKSRGACREEEDSDVSKN